MLPASFSPRASRDVSEAVRWYEGQRSTLGRDFLRELERVLLLLAAHPAAGSPVSPGTRRVLLRRFPYALYYSVLNGSIFIRACLHHRQQVPSL
jgi:plasmid stabilization system protein ParE